jgi:hypothetical protein
MNKPFPSPPGYTITGAPLLYRVGREPFANIIDAECYKLDADRYHSRLPIELYYKDRWNIMGDVPEPKRVPL